MGSPIATAIASIHHTCVRGRSVKFDNNQNSLDDLELETQFVTAKDIADNLQGRDSEFMMAFCDDYKARCLSAFDEQLMTHHKM